MADERKKERRGSNIGFAGTLVKVKWLSDFNDRVKGDVAEVPEGKAAYWIKHGMVEDLDEIERLKAEAKAKEVKAAPKDKAVKGSTDK